MSPVQATSTAQTADELLKGVDLRGKRFLVTSISTGVGTETARVLATHGAHVVGTARNMKNVQPVVNDIRAQAVASGGGIETVQLDLASLASVRACADKLVQARTESFDVIIANAGVMEVLEEHRRTTIDGFETNFAVNYLGHFLLINRLKQSNLIKPGGRVVLVSSTGHREGDIDLDDLNIEHSLWNAYNAYQRSKTAMILFAVEFDRIHKVQSIRATAVHPGTVLSDTVKKLVVVLAEAATQYTWQTPEQGAANVLWPSIIGTSDEVGGKYCQDCHIAEVDDGPGLRSGVRSYALDLERAKVLWQKSVDMVGERF